MKSTKHGNKKNRGSNCHEKSDKTYTVVDARKKNGGKWEGVEDFYGMRDSSIFVRQLLK